MTKNIYLDEHVKGVYSNPNSWKIFFRSGVAPTNSAISTITIMSSSPQLVKIFNGTFGDDTNEKLFGAGTIQFTFKCEVGAEGEIEFSNRRTITALGSIRATVEVNIASLSTPFVSRTNGSPLVGLYHNDIPENISEFYPFMINNPNVSISFDLSILKYFKKLRKMYITTSVVANYANALTLSMMLENMGLNFVYIGQASGKSPADGSLPVNNNYMFDLSIFKHTVGDVILTEELELSKGNLPRVKGKLSDIKGVVKVLQIRNANSLVTGSMDDIDWGNALRVVLNCSKIKGYTGGKTFNNDFTLLDISGTGLTDIQTDQLLTDLNNSITTNSSRSIVIKHRTSASDTIVTSLNSKGVTLTTV